MKIMTPDDEAREGFFSLAEIRMQREALQRWFVEPRAIQVSLRKRTAARRIVAKLDALLERFGKGRA